MVVNVYCQAHFERTVFTICSSYRQFRHIFVNEQVLEVAEYLNQIFVWFCVLFELELGIT